MGRLDHVNIVSGYAVGGENGWHYFAMEYVDGRSLQRWLELLGKLSVSDAVYIALSIARALQYAHDHKLVHRDIKPANVMITRTGTVKVTDLGVAKLLDDDDDVSLTQTGHSVGTPCYMSPEQARNSKEADGRTDIYALGCLLYCTLTGQPPFTGATLLELLQSKESGKFLSARRSNAEIPKRLDFIIEKMVAKQVRYRYQTCNELIKDLESLQLAAPALSFIPREGSGPGETPVPGTMTAPPTEVGSADDSADTPTDIWYVCYKTAEGRPVTEKRTTGEVLELIENEDFDLTARASRTPKGGFRALACYREFEPGFLARVAKVAVDRKTTKFRTLYKKIEEEDCERQRQRFRENPPKPVQLTWLQVGYWFVSRGLVLYGLFLFLRLLFKLLFWLAG